MSAASRRSLAPQETISLSPGDPLRDLFEACKHGDVSRVRSLVTTHNVNARDTAGRKSSPLHFAAGRGHHHYNNWKWQHHFTTSHIECLLATRSWVYDDMHFLNSLSLQSIRVISRIICSLFDKINNSSICISPSPVSRIRSPVAASDIKFPVQVTEGGKRWKFFLTPGPMFTLVTTAA